MLYFELSKLVDSINKYGRCILSIKVDHENYNELEIMTRGDGFDIDDDTLLQILSIMYSEAFLPEKYKNFFVKNSDINVKPLLCITDLFLPRVNEKSEITITTKDLNGIVPFEKENNKIPTIKLCGLIYNMLSKAKPLTHDLDISARNIYKSVQSNDTVCEFNFFDIDNVVNYFDKNLIPSEILSVLKLRKNLMATRKAGDDTVKIISIIAELADFIDGKQMANEKISEILERYDYDSIDKNIKSTLDTFLNEHGYDTNGDYHL